MHVDPRLLFLVLTTFPSLAYAEPAAPSWSLGAGVSLSSGPVVVGALPLGAIGAIGGLGSAAGLAIARGADPVVSVTVERRAGDDTWLMFRGIAGFGSTSAQDGGTSTDEQRLGASLGLRQVLTGGAPVALSAFATLNANGSRTHLLAESTAMGEAESTALSLGASAGLALERELMEGLSLRLASSVLGASWSSLRFTATGSEQTARAVSARVELEPWLELRLAI